MSLIHKPAIRNASTGHRVRWFRVSHWWEEQTQANHVILFGCVLNAPQSTFNCKYSMHHTRKRATFAFFMKYLLQLGVSVKRHLFNEQPLEVILKVIKDNRFITVCLFCHKKRKKTRWDITYMWLVNTRMVLKWNITRPDSTFTHVAETAIYNSRSPRRTTYCQCTSTTDRTTTSHSSWNLSHQWTKTTEI